MSGDYVLEYGERAAELPPEVERKPQQDVKAEQFRSRKGELAVRFVAFRTRGCAQCSANTTIPLGILTMFIQNAAEIEFSAKGFSKHYEFRMRREMEEALWFRRGKNWSKELYRPRWTPDHPDDPPECLRPPRLFSLDSPGPMVVPGYKGELNLGPEGGAPLKTDYKVDAVVIQHNFLTRVQERSKGTGFETVWAWASQAIPWHSIIQIHRPKGIWQRIGLNEIKRGHVQIKKPSW